jgi:hypothetical protein
MAEHLADIHSSRRCAYLGVYWLYDAIRNVVAKRSSGRNSSWANRDRTELYDAACRMAHEPPSAPFSEEPQRTYHRRLKDAIDDGNLAVLDMRGLTPNEKTLVTRGALRAYAKTSRWSELREFLREWDRLNPPKLEVSGLPALPLKR